jgi:hypothetical protein
MLDAVLLPLERHHALRRFQKSAQGFWRGSDSDAVPARSVESRFLNALEFRTGTMLSGDVTEAAGRIQLPDRNFPRLAECLSSTNRIDNLLTAFDRLEPARQREG